MSPADPLSELLNRLLDTCGTLGDKAWVGLELAVDACRYFHNPLNPRALLRIPH